MKTVRVLVTGSRFLDDAGTVFVWSVLDRLLAEIDLFDVSAARDVTITSGGAKGVDDAVVRWALRPGIVTKTYPADWAAHGQYAGPKRNLAMVGLGADLCLAFPRRDSKGTWGCLRMAADAGIPVRIHPLPKIVGRQS